MPDNLGPEQIKELALWTTILAFVMPLVVATVSQSHWRKPIKATVTLLSCVLGAFVELMLKGDFSTTNWTLTSLALLAGTITFFLGWWKPSGVADVVEKVTDVTTPRAGDNSST